MPDIITSYYQEQLPEGELKNNILQAPCPFCRSATGKESSLVVFLNRESYFHGYFTCKQYCVAGGFPLHFARLRGGSMAKVPGYDPNRTYHTPSIDLPVKNINADILGFKEKLTGDQLQRFAAHRVGKTTLDTLQIGYNGRYLVFPYIQADGNYHTARCVHPNRPEDSFWFGDENFSSAEFRLFNAPDVECCENGSLFVVEGEENLLTLKELGLPGVAVPSSADLVQVHKERLRWVRTLFVWVNNTREAEEDARRFATRLGYKVRLIRWADGTPKSATLTDLAKETGKAFRNTVFTMVKEAKSFSPFSSPTTEYLHFRERLRLENSGEYAARRTGFQALDRALGGMHGINIVGGTPKAGKSCLFIQIASSMAQQKLPVIYYDFENGRQKIYSRILCRLARLGNDQLEVGHLDAKAHQRLTRAHAALQAMLPWFRVVTDRRLDPELMRRHIDFLRHETNHGSPLVVIDSLHKLPFKDLSERRTGIDGWLRQMEAIRDEMQVAFLVVSELTRNPDGTFDRKPHLGSFKGSGDIGYSADNALVLQPNWNPFDGTEPDQRTNELWLVASREHTPGRVATYRLDYPYWGFIEEQ
ncbi:MAG: DNA helicase [Desulfobulbus propionicus]|nr:MAG: DNA helicase [Desulfobulbus propionicus]